MRRFRDRKAAPSAIIPYQASSQQPTATAALSGTNTCLTLLLRRTGSHQPVQSQIPPRRIAGLLLGALDAKRCVLIRNDIVLVVGVERLVLRRNVDFLGRELDARKVLEQVGVVGGVEMQVGEGRVARLMGTQLP